MPVYATKLTIGIIENKLKEHNLFMRLLRFSAKILSKVLPTVRSDGVNPGRSTFVLLKEHNLLKSTKRKIVKYGQSVSLGCMRVEFIRTNHSIADAAALAIFTPAGLIIHTGFHCFDIDQQIVRDINIAKFHRRRDDIDTGSTATATATVNWRRRWVCRRKISSC